MSAQAPASAVNLLRERDAEGRWPFRFRLRGREFRLIPGGPSTAYADDSVEVRILRVWNARGDVVDVKVRDTDPVVLLSRETYLGGEVLVA